MTMASNEEKIGSLKNSIDMTIVGDNLNDIIEFTLEKYEFKNDTTLAAEVREEASTKMKEALWQRVEELRKRRVQILAATFTLAETTLDEVVNKGK